MDFIAGSEIKALLAHPMVPNNISHKAMLHQLIQVMIPGMTLFEEIHALKPGHLMVIGENNDNSFDIEEQAYGTSTTLYRASMIIINQVMNIYMMYKAL